MRPSAATNDPEAADDLGDEDEGEDDDICSTCGLELDDDGICPDSEDLDDDVAAAQVDRNPDVVDAALVEQLLMRMMRFPPASN